MSQLIYVDTNVYIDYFQGRKDSKRDLGKSATELLKSAIKCKYKIVVSLWVLEELSRYISLERIDQLLSRLEKRDKVQYVDYSIEQEHKAETYKNRDDALHALIALNEDAAYLVTRNLKDFRDFSKQIKAKLPEDL